jgi:hypothetical protein
MRPQVQTRQDNFSLVLREVLPATAAVCTNASIDVLL